MGMNPDDIEHITLAEMVGLGTNNPDNIEIVGADFETTKRRFKKSRSNQGDFGQGIRRWLLNGPYSIEGISDPIDHEFVDNEAGVVAKAGEDQWSEAIYFTDDRLDLRDFYNLQSGDQVVSYNLCYFDAPQDQLAEFWIGSDEALKIYLNGEEIYRYAGTRSFQDDKLVSTKFTVNVKEGENRLLVKSLQKYGRYDFCINICEPESDPDFDGNRIWGLKFKTESTVTGINNSRSQVIEGFTLFNAYPNPFNPSTTIRCSISKDSEVKLSIFDMLGKEVAVLADGYKTAGNYSYNFDASDLSSGIYFYTIRSGNFVQTKKMLLMK